MVVRLLKLCAYGCVYAAACIVEMLAGWAREHSEERIKQLVAGDEEEDDEDDEEDED